MEFFVYGTLTDPDRAASVLEAFEYGGEAVLEGLTPVEGRYPTLAPGGRTAGRILRTDEVGVLDGYEGVEEGLYVRIAIPADEGDTVQVYVGDPDRLGADAAWPGSGSFRERVLNFVREADVRVIRGDPG